MIRPPPAKKLVFFLPILIFFAYFFLVFVMDRSTENMMGKGTYGAGTRSVIPLAWLLAAVPLAVVLLLLYRRPLRGRGLRYSVCVLTVLGAVFSFWSYFRPNVGANFVDYEAYWSNVILLYNGDFINMCAKSFYGHYALFMLPFFKLVGLNAVTVALTQGIEMLIVYCAILYCTSKITNDTVLRLCCIIAMFYSLNGTGIYPQGTPHRLLFPALMMVLGVRVTLVHASRASFVFGFFLALFAIIWNTETGMVVLCAWALLYFLHSMYTFKGRARWLRCAVAVCSMPVILLAAWQTVSLINMAILGSWERMSFHDFVFPLLSSYIEGIAYSVDFSLFRGIPHWVVTAAFLLLCLFIGIGDFVFGHSSPRRLLVTYFAAMGLMNALYFFNRAAYGNLHQCVFLIALMLILLLMEHTGHSFFTSPANIQSGIRAGIFAGHVYGFALLLVLAIFGFPPTVASLQKYQDLTTLDEIPRALEEAGVPEDALLYSPYASFIDMASDKYTYSQMNSNCTATSEHELGQKLLAAQRPFCASVFSNDNGTAAEISERWRGRFQQLTGQDAFDDLYMFPEEITISVHGGVSDTIRFFLFRLRS